ncbi:MAG: hypothetical protein EOP62_13340 [Sphingomonadales bacterium]|nr:MAG: hypothetical protein EOP62_13340 [Sphingomonadales bacterium]
MILSIALLAIAPDPFPAPKTPTAVLQISCRQGECAWQQIRSIERVSSDGGEVLRKLTSRAGTSTHGVRRNPPAHYSPRLRIDWERAPKQEHVLCSKRRPTMVFESDGEFVVTRLGLADLGGYEYAGAALYMQVCHNLAPGRWNEKQIAKLGYGGKRGQQDRYPTLSAALASLR